VEDHKESKYKLELAEKEVSKLRDVEASLFKTLKTAEDTGNSMVEQASKKAELTMRETDLKAETMLNDARARAREIMDEAEEKAQRLMSAMESRVKEMAQHYRMLENHRDNLLSDLLVLANNTLERVEQAEAKVKKHDLGEIVGEAEKATRDQRMQQRRREKQQQPAEQPQSQPNEDNEEGGSFFDNV
jgi:cell division initiation protein